MLEEKYIELIQADVDGELPEQQRAELGRYLLANPEARALRDELRRTCAALENVRPVEPPADLRTSILREIGLAAAPRRSAGRTGLSGLWASGPVLRYAAAFAGGLLISAIAFQFGSTHRPGLDVTQIAGTMASQDPAASSAPVDAVSIDRAQVRGSVRLFQSRTMRFVEFDLTAREPLEVVVVHDGQEARFRGGGSAGTGGSGRYGLVLDGAGEAGSPIELKFIASGAVIHEDRLEAPALE
jgi:hypothetical protein